MNSRLLGHCRNALLPYWDTLLSSTSSYSQWSLRSENMSNSYLLFICLFPDARRCYLKIINASQAIYPSLVFNLTNVRAKICHGNPEEKKTNISPPLFSLLYRVLSKGGGRCPLYPISRTLSLSTQPLNPPLTDIIVQYSFSIHWLSDCIDLLICSLLILSLVFHLLCVL